MIYCRKCGVSNRDGSRFCNGCGRKLAGDPSGDSISRRLREGALTGLLWRGASILPFSRGRKRDLDSSGTSDAETYATSHDDADTLLEEDYVTSPPFDDDVRFPDDVDGDEEEGPVEAELLLIDDLEIEPSAPDEDELVQSVDEDHTSNRRSGPDSEDGADTRPR